ncbi:IclR family transcriptional regulator [Agromyces protaetiae]|uniref:IclR family transcriptional regulator n=1 Tax=Agromyces protaetiae TaxID=2509455 RepID=UPI001FB6DCCB|nr:helix-turn-helix domain-containing protein [Agromyces protaetiae]
MPALDKALDILELLADRAGGLSQQEIARETGRSPSQLYRVLVTLERRGYLVRDPQSGLTTLGTKLFDLAHRREPLRGLLAAAEPVLQELAETLRQSCNLGVADGDRVRIVAQAESPAEFGFRVRVGALFPAETPSGRVLSAYGAFSGADASPAPLREDGGFVVADAAHPGITDVVFPVLRRDGAAIAVVTVPYVDTSFSDTALDTVVEYASSAAARIAARL